MFRNPYSFKPLEIYNQRLREDESKRQQFSDKISEAYRTRSNTLKRRNWRASGYRQTATQKQTQQEEEPQVKQYYTLRRAVSQKFSYPSATEPLRAKSKHNYLDNIYYTPVRHDRRTTMRMDAVNGKLVCFIDDI